MTDPLGDFTTAASGVCPSCGTAPMQQITFTITDPIFLLAFGDGQPFSVHRLWCTRCKTLIPPSMPQLDKLRPLLTADIRKEWKSIN